jgi:hypothetical protein
MFKYLKNEKGDSSILGFIIVAPIMLWFFIYIIFGGAFLLEINQMNTIVNKTFDIALVEGQYTTDLRSALVTELTSSGFDASSLEISITPSAAGDSNNSTYIGRGEMIEVTVLSRKAHPLYNVSFKAGDESDYYIGVQIQGMSEKWKDF